MSLACAVLFVIGTILGAVGTVAFILMHLVAIVSGAKRR